MPADSLARYTGIPVHYLRKIMRQLVVSGLVVARRGPGGGFALRRPARTITFAQILTAGDTYADDDACVFGSGRCNPQVPCALHDSYSSLRDTLNNWMNQTTLADVGRDPRLWDR